VLLLGCSLAAITSASEKHISFQLPENTRQPLAELKVIKAPLTEALGVIAKTAGVVIHYADLPKDVMTLTCKETTVKQIFDCLLARKADVVFRYKADVPEGQAEVLEEVWVMGSSDDAGEGVFNDIAPESASLSKRKAERNPIQQMLAETDINKLIETTRSGDPESRANALAMLAVRGKGPNPLVRDVFKAALSDPSAEVRAQAVFGLSKYQDASVPADLAAALHDDDVSVRLMAVDSADAHPVLLQQALGDSDEDVRAFAATKIEALAIR
jgi:hypothetical protein